MDGSEPTTSGFWTQLTHPHCEASYWTHLIHDTYPMGTIRGQVHNLVTTVNRFRKSLARDEPVFSATTGPSDRMDAVKELLARPNPTVSKWVPEHSSVADAVADCPVPGLLVWPPSANQSE